MEKELKEQYLKLFQLNRSERRKLTEDQLRIRPEFLQANTQKWRNFKPCPVHVLLVTDSLNFGMGPFGLSEFIGTFLRLQRQLFLKRKYFVTLAHRGSPSDEEMLESNTFIHNRIRNFKFDASPGLANFDQIWLFGSRGPNLTNPEISAIEKYMNEGGGIFATGDHGDLGKNLCGQIPRVKDMRIWSDTNSNQHLNEVSMDYRRRNDTNRPGAGQIDSNRFDNQSDTIPQIISPRIFPGGRPHPLLSVSTSIQNSGRLEVMPDHPHEGQCAPERAFSVKNPVTGATQSIRSQNIATSFVLANSIANDKDPTDAHCFPSIGVFDGRQANVGRIVVDSTWHHFVNINLNGSGTSLPGLTDADFDLVQRYYMNISNWMTRKNTMVCGFRWLLPTLLLDSQLIEANLNNSDLPLKDIRLHELRTIGSLAREILASEFGPSQAMEYLLGVIGTEMPEIEQSLHVWLPETTDKPNKNGDSDIDWINRDIIMDIAIGAGFIALRDNFDFSSEKMTEKTFEKSVEVYSDGIKHGLEVALKGINENFNSFQKDFQFKK